MFTPRNNPHEKSCKHRTLQQLGGKKPFYVPNRLLTCILLTDSQSAPSGLKKNVSPGRENQQL